MKERVSDNPFPAATRFSRGESFVLRLLLPPVRGSGLKADTLWNAIVNGAASAMSVVLLLVSSRFCGAWWCGVVALALAMSQQLFTLGNFTMGNYQASDVEEAADWGDYIAAKLLSIGAMLAVAAAWLLAGDFGAGKTACFIALLAYQTSDAFGGAFFSRYQQKGRLDAACRVRFAKVASFMVVYVAVVVAVRNPAVALACGAAVHIALFFVLDVPLARVFGPLRIHAPGRRTFSVLAGCFPLALASFLVMFVNNGPRFAVDSTLGEEALAAYSALFMVSFVVAICADFIMNPQVVRLAEAVRNRDRKAARRTLLQPFAAIVVLGAAAIAVGATVGERILGMLFDLELSGNRTTLCLVLCGGVLVALYQLSQTVLVVLRRQSWSLPGVIAAAVFTFASSSLLVSRFGLLGAALCYTVSVAFLAAVTAAFAAAFYSRISWKKAGSRSLE